MTTATVPVGELFTIAKGKKPSLISDRPTPGLVRLLQINDLRGEGSPLFAPEQGAVLATEEDVLIAWDGANAGTVGFGLSGAVGSTLAVLRPATGLVLPRFAGRFLQSRFHELNSSANGAAVPHVARTKLEGMTIPLPSLADQRRMAALLDAADRIRRKRRESLRLLDELLRSVFLEMFGDPVRNEKGWRVESIGRLAQVRRGASPRPISQFMGGTVPWIKIGDATASTDLYIHKTADFVTEAGARRSVALDVGAIVISNSGSVGLARILGIPGCIHDGWLAVEDLNDHVNSLYFVALINQMTAFLRASAPAGTQPNLNIEIVRNLAVPLPPIELQSRFAAIVGVGKSSGERFRAAGRSADFLFDSLAHQAFGSGG